MTTSDTDFDAAEIENPITYVGFSLFDIIIDCLMWSVGISLLYALLLVCLLLP